MTGSPSWSEGCPCDRWGQSSRWLDANLPFFGGPETACCRIPRTSRHEPVLQLPWTTGSLPLAWRSTMLFLVLHVMPFQVSWDFWWNTRPNLCSKIFEARQMLSRLPTVEQTQSDVPPPSHLHCLLEEADWAESASFLCWWAAGLEHRPLPWLVPKSTGQRL